MSEPARLLTKAALRRYLGGMPWSEIEARMKRGQIPGPMFGYPIDDKNARWDIKAVDRAIDAASSLPSSIEASIDELDRAFGFIGPYSASAPAAKRQPSTSDTQLPSDKPKKFQRRYRRLARIIPDDHKS